MKNSIFPKFLSDKKRILKSDQEVDVELDAQTENFLEEEAPTSKKYLSIFYILATIVFLFLFSRLFYLQIFLGAQNQERAEENRLRIRISEAPRGIIYDRNKKPLVKNVASFSVEIYPTDLPKKKEDRAALYQKLSSILNLSVSEIEKVEEKRNLQESITLKEHLSQEEAILLESRIINLPSTKVAKNPSRQYAGSEFALSHILGYTSKINEEEYQKHPNYSLSDSIGKSGLEDSYEEYLKGEDGKQRVEVDSSGKVVRILDSSTPKPGNSLILGLDLGLQEQMVKSLSDMINKSNAKGGVAIAADPRNGTILGLVSLPAYDNNLFANGITKEDYDKLLKSPQNPLFNRAISALYPPGSTVKPIVASGALTDGVITPSKSIDDPGVISIVNKYNPFVTYTFPDWKPGGHGRVDIYKALAQSCDIFFYALGGGWQDIQGLGEQRLTSWFSKFGLGKKTGIDIAGEKEGLIPTSSWKEKVKKEAWYQGDTYHISIGQGDLLATPIQLLNYTMAIANGGTFYKPHLVSEIDSPEDQLIKKIEPEVTAKDLVPQKNLDVVREGMRMAAAEGTARQLASLSFSSAGKTGTAQNPHGENHGWFISFAPFDDPKIVTVVLLENGGEGSSTAVPVTKDILQYWWDNVKDKE